MAERGNQSERGSVPHPEGAESLAELIEALVRLRAWAGDPSYAVLAKRVGQVRARRGLPPGECLVSRSTVHELFSPQRRRIDVELLADVVAALEAPDVRAWRQAYAALTRRAEAAQAVSVDTAVPAPRTPLIGRHAELRALTHPATTTMAVIGMPGIGKTELTLHAAAQRLRQSPAREQVYVDLRGFHSSLPPAAPEAVLESVLRQRGASSRHLAALKLDERVTKVAGLVRPDWLVVLDNARDFEHVAALLQAFAEACVIVTSRHRLVGFSGAVVQVAPLSEQDSLELLGLADSELAHGEGAQDARAIAQLCGGVPLNLSLTAASLVERDWTLADHVARLQAMPSSAALAPALATSYDLLAPEPAKVLRILARHPGDGATAASLAAAVGVSEDEVAPAVEVLVDHHLAHRAPDGKLHLHDVVRDYAQLRGVDADPQSQVKLSRTRLAEFYCVEVQRAVITGGVPRAEALAPPGLNERVPGAKSQARAWLEAETQSVLVLLSELGDQPELQWRLALAISPWLEDSARLVDCRSVLLAAWDAAHDADAHSRATLAVELASIHQRFGAAEESLRWAELALDLAGDDPPRDAYNQRGGAEIDLGRNHDGLRSFQLSVEQALGCGDVVQAGRSLNYVGATLLMMSRPEQARAALDQARQLSEECGDLLNVGSVCANTADLLEREGRYEEALVFAERAAQIDDDCDVMLHKPRNLFVLGHLHGRLGHDDVALGYLRSAIDFAVEHRWVMYEAEARQMLGAFLAEREDYAGALEQYAAALRLDEQFESVWTRVDSLLGLGQALVGAGRASDAEPHFREAAELARECEMSREGALATRGLGDVAWAAGDGQAAAIAWAQAHDQLLELHDPEASALADKLRLALPSGP